MGYYRSGFSDVNLVRLGLIRSIVISIIATAIFGLALVFGIYQSLDAWTKTSFQDIIVTMAMVSGFFIFAFEILEKLYERVETRQAILSRMQFGSISPALNDVFTTLVFFTLIFGAWVAVFIFTTPSITIPMLIIGFIVSLYIAMPQTGDDYWLLGLWFFCVFLSFALGWIDLTEWIKVQTVIIPLIQGFLGGI